MFRYTDNDNYYRVSWNSYNGFARLEANVNGTFITLARDFRGYRPGVLQSIAVEVEGPLIQVFNNGDPLFSAYDTTHASGGIALFSRDASRFDNVLVAPNDSAPEIVIAAPVAHSVLPGAPLAMDVSAVVRNAPAPNDSVSVRYEDSLGTVLCNVATESPAGVYTAQCPGVPAGDYTVQALLLDNGVEVDRDENASVGVGFVTTGSHRYDALGDSITRGVGDNYATDNLNLADQRTLGVSGWPGLLGDLLTTAAGAPVLVGNEGISGDRASTLRFSRLGSILERNPDSDRALIMIGTNDSNTFNTTTPADLVTHIQAVIDELHSEGRNMVYVALLPPVWGGSLSTTYPDPLDPSATRTETIRSFNSAIQSLVPQTGVALGPDLFSCFLTESVNRFSLFEDSLHPNGLGLAMIAALWRDAITGGPVTIPADPCPAPIYIVESLDPYLHGHKQNLLEEGDEYYTDESSTLSNVPPELQGGVWISAANADNANTDSNFVSFDVGSDPVSVYIAYDPAGSAPTSSTHEFTPASLTGSLDVSDPSVGTMSVVSAAGVTGTVVIGGNKSGGTPGSQQAYVVIVVP
jgi:lysophospholipase L1-like esterase